MAAQPSGSVDRSGYQPDFELSHRGVIREDNWPEYEAQGFFVSLTNAQEEIFVELLTLVQDIYGVENVYTGDAWSYEAERPLRHIPGTGIYVHPNGHEHAAKRRAEHASHAASDPATN